MRGGHVHFAEKNRTMGVGRLFLRRECGIFAANAAGDAVS